MSGTSADGIDAALCEIHGEPPHLEARIVNASTTPYPEGFQARILAASRITSSQIDELCQVNMEMGELFAQAALDVIKSSQLPPEKVDLIGSHGQTVWHNVRPDGKVNATLQITEASVIAERTGITTVSNFRPRDIAAGGQGAPLTAYADWLLLRHPIHWRAVQNIGGIGNVTFLPPLSDSASQPLAFDTGPGNALIDSAVSIYTQGQAAYDQDGQMAAKGKVDGSLLEELLDGSYYERRPPKTTGRELFSTQMVETLIHETQLDPNDMIATLTALTAYSIADAYQRFAPAPVKEVILGGGGYRNPVLVTMLRDILKPTAVLTHEDVGLDSDNKEALVFAVLAHETWYARPGNHPGLTGADHPVVLGHITPGNNYVQLIRKTWCST